MTEPSNPYTSTSQQLATAVSVTAVAGYVDAIGYLRLGQLFVSFMSGNTTKLRMFTARADNARVTQAALLVLLFVVESFSGHLITRKPAQRRFSLVVALEAALILSVPLLEQVLSLGPEKPAEQPVSILVVPLVLAMGMQNASLQHVGALSVGTTYVTGILAHLGEQLAGLFGAERRKALRRSGFYALLWLGLVLGAVCGGLLYNRFALGALFAPEGG